MNEEMCEQGTQCVTPPGPAPTGTGERHTPTSPHTWRLEPGATSELHQHQAPLISAWVSPPWLYLRSGSSL